MTARSVAGRARIETLRATRELGYYTDRKLERLLSYFDEVSMPAGTLIAHEGVRAAQFVVVMGGRLKAGPQTLTAGDSCGWKAMWDRESNSATVVVEADARLLVMSHAQFRAVKAVADIAA